MSDYIRIAQMSVEDAYGPMAAVRVDRGPGRTIVWATRPTDDGEEVMALAAGPDHGRACARLIQAVVRGDTMLTTAEVAEVLGLTGSRVRQMTHAGEIATETPGPGRPGHVKRYRPAEVHRALGLPRRKGMRE